MKKKNSVENKMSKSAMLNQAVKEENFRLHKRLIKMRAEKISQMNKYKALEEEYESYVKRVEPYKHSSEKDLDAKIQEYVKILDSQKKHSKK